MSKWTYFVVVYSIQFFKKIEAPPLQIQGVFKDLAVFQGVIPGPYKSCNYFFKNEQECIEASSFKTW